MKKLCSRRGLTLAETLTALAVFAILSVALVSGTNAAWKVYRNAVVASEARTLRSTLAQSLSNELRYAQNIQVDETGAVTFDSEVFGAQVAVRSNEGRIQIVQTKEEGDPIPYDLLPKKSYTSGLRAEAKVSFADGLFTLEITISHPLLPDEGRKTTLTVQALNPPPAEETPAP